MAKSTYILVLMLSLTAFHSAIAQRENSSPSDFNRAFLYDLSSPVYGEYEVAVGSNEATIFLKLTQRTNTININRMHYEVRENYEADDVIRSADLNESHFIKQKENSSYYRFEIPVSDESHYVFVFIEGVSAGANFNYRYDISLNNDQNFPLTDLIVMEAEEEIPVFTSSIPNNASFRVVSVYGEDSLNAYLYYYSHEFPPNLPPMAETGADIQKSLKIDTILSVQLNQSLSFENEGLYFCQLDTTSLSGISFRISSKYYPRFVTPEALIAPLRYISTSEEMENLTESDEAKAALDRYWIKVTRSQERAKDVIRNYFRQVTNANILFTTYKEGWKTGQGMVYVLFGPPDEVYSTGAEERWIYNSENDLMENLAFTFVKVRNIFTTRHYNLLRDEEYRKFWYRNIDLWRKGRKQI
ncbi:GWxTD domain-containing protein [Catalinimonas alkaloidigena]|uniref:GWxTD domain-containing protein n=1 Tax=Catalinimonas alkaloidigena TaxID=1075417 RepID=UPI0024072CC1|nr:GWxTD domain-containing protein [Catalinimonas alkaloidigena]MDF9797367.1 GWxTD domain-containing protein [Catalinimonas alkaloidigena]